MNKTAIKNFAIWARQKLISDITYKAGMLGITENGIAEKLPQSTNDLHFYDIGTKNYSEISGIEIKQREALVKAIKTRERSFKNFKEAFENVVEEVAYTWFNRLIAIRFMEINDYLPSGIRVLSSENRAKLEPDFVTSPFDTDLEFTPYEQDRVIQLKDENKLDELFRMLFIKQCNKLHDILPDLFEKTDDYSELLLTISFTDKDGIVYRLVHDIDEDDFNVEKEGQVEIIGWMYQYYNIEPKDQVFANLKKNVKITKDKIPAATQLFTPDWIVRYMVENSLGRLWIEHCQALGGLDSEYINGSYWDWKYYIDEAEQEPEVEEKLKKMRENLKTLSPEDIKVIDPCMGSGHILVYAFDVLMRIYEAQGYTQRDAARLIVEKNIFGLDIDKRAYQLSYFAVMMKARQYNRRILNGEIKPNLFAINDSTAMTREVLDFIANGNQKMLADLQSISRDLTDATEYGSIINVEPVDFEAIYSRFDEIRDSDYSDLFGSANRQLALTTILPLVKQAETMAQKYDVVCTNPPYMGGSGMNNKLSEYVKKYYPDSKSDLFAVFIEKCGDFSKRNGYYAMITQHAWMFLSSYEKLREKMLCKTIINMAHLGARAFDEIGGEVVQTTAFVNFNYNITSYQGTYARLVDVVGEKEKKALFLKGQNLYITTQENFSKIPGSPIAYWANEATIRAFENKSVGYYGDPKQGFATGSNDRFLRFWNEVSIQNIGFDCKNRNIAKESKKKWFPCNKGGGFRRWFGNNNYVANWENDGFEMTSFTGSVIRNPQYYFRKGITWSSLTSGKLSMRYSPEGFIFESKGSVCFLKNDDNLLYLLGLLNTEVVAKMLLILSPTLDYHEGPMSKVPVIIDDSAKLNVEKIVIENVDLTKDDWDSFETSWDFKEHPLLCYTPHNSMPEVPMNYTVASAFEAWSKECDNRFNQLKANEEELNRIFINIYGLQDELTPNVEEKDVTVRKADLQRDIKSLISYAVGCMLGRYSLDVPGLAYAGGDFSDQWVVISDQYYKKEVVEYYVRKELSGIDCLAESDEPGGTGIHNGETSSERRNVCTVGSDEKGGSFCSFQHCRGTGKKLYEGIRELSFDCQGVACGTGNTAYDLCSPEILDAISNGNGNQLVQRGWKDADRIDWKAIHYSLTTKHYSPDADNCIPITDEEYFEDDIVGLFCAWLKKVYGEKTLEENLDFIADALGNKGKTSREVIRSYFLNDFIKDHIKTYQKRPIYWLFDSGKQNGFKALCYMHRWNADTTGNMRVEYLHRMQRVYEKEIQRMQEIMDNSRDNKEITNATKRKEKLQKQIKETKEYDAKVAHLALSRIDIDLDDGVKVNYEKVQTASDGKKMQILAKF